MFSDIINSTSVTRDDTGTASTQRYTPWGETRTVGGLTTDHTYTGQTEDQSTGLRFYNARYQDPVIGRFVSADTIIPNPANGQSYNRYAYVGNNPIIYNDPTGHCQEMDDVFGCVIYGNGWTYRQFGPRNLVTTATDWRNSSYDDAARVAFDYIDPGELLRPFVPVANVGCDATGCADPGSGEVSADHSDVDVGPNQAKWCSLHLFACADAFKTGSESRHLAKELFPGSDPLSLERRNAFQHAYWMAIVTFDSDSATGLLLGDAHEMDVTNGIRDSTKDLLNNQRGAIVGSAAGSKQEIRNTIYLATVQGFLSCISDTDLVPC